MLCGTSGERTSSIFVDFVLSKNNQAKIIILDISEMQLTESKKLLTKLFPKADIEYIKADAKKTSLISESIDFIETDGFFEYFNSKDLLLLMKEWRRLLRKDGFATTRAFASSSFFGKMVDIIRVFICKHYLDVIIHVHHMNAIEDIINKARFKFVQGGGSFCPTFKRFSLLKKG
ncbi:class I SAM-dependent methyltransferase [Candidatus Woesebacteria bacterium]|nr:class I SAM-dependent methyltransferase [Candidatus Woesebacteria bacterium]